MGPKTRILDATMLVFRRHGFRRSSIEQVAEAAGLTRQALYHHFESKEALFRAYLKQVDTCPECHEAWSEIRSDDAAPWLTILIVGHVMAPIMISMSKSGRFTPLEMSLILVPVLIGLSLLILPRAKAAFMAAIWALRAQSS